VVKIVDSTRQNSSSHHAISMSILVILGRKCTLAASLASPVSHVEYAPRALLRLEKDGTDGQTDARPLLHCTYR